MERHSNRSSLGSSRRSSKAAGWFYEIDGQTHGPCHFRELRELALESKLLSHHLVWKDGSEDQQAASSILGLIPKQKSTYLSQPTSELSDDNPYATPKGRTIADGPPGGLYLPHLHPTNFPLYLTTLVIPLLVILFAEQITSPNSQTLFTAVAVFSFIGWLALSVIYLHRAWGMMLMFGASLSGGKAIRFLVIPFFNALWCFVSVFGWSKLWNSSVGTHPGLRPAQKVMRPFFFLFPILFLLSQALLVMHFLIEEWPTDLRDEKHLASLAIWASTILVALICWGQICQSINFLARKKS